jgi:rhodanese-related sulfurtransferase
MMVEYYHRGNVMKKLFVLAIVAIIAFLSIYFGHQWLTTDKTPELNQSASGKIINGYRVLPIQLTPEKVHLTVYRGDYIRFAFDDSIINPILSIPSLSIEKELPRNLEKAPYFKMKKVGAYPFSLGKVTGDITVIEFIQPQYREVTAKEAAELIETTKPLILDVRTSMEFNQGHLNDAVLLPVQELQSRINELAAFKDRDILIYCATGNRSTVASKILTDHDFKQLYNLRRGIVDWRKNHPIVR